jgi:CO/xanthine dehydrogenase FAD-binding subunit
MRAFAYERPTRLDDAVELLARHGPDCRLLAGGTDLIIRLRDGTARPNVVIDLKQIAELDGEIRDLPDGGLRIGALTTMTTIADDPRIRRDHQALAEAAAVVGSVQIRNRATLAGNVCNASPAADTAPSLLVDGGVVEAHGLAGPRRIPLDAFFVRSGVTTLAPGELVTAIELPAQPDRGTVHLRRTRRRGHDLASVTLAASVTADGTARLAYGSLGPRPLLVTDETGVLADPASPDLAKMEQLEALFVGAAPSPRSMRASPEYRLAMLHVLGLRAIGIAIDRLLERAAAR